MWSANPTKKTSRISFAQLLFNYVWTIHKKKNCCRFVGCYQIFHFYQISTLVYFWIFYYVCVYMFYFCEYFNAFIATKNKIGFGYQDYVLRKQSVCYYCTRCTRIHTRNFSFFFRVQSIFVSISNNYEHFNSMSILSEEVEESERELFGCLRITWLHNVDTVLLLYNVDPLQAIPSFVRNISSGTYV